MATITKTFQNFVGGDWVDATSGDKFNMSVRMPIGVVGVITPWNFPIAIPSWKIAPALVCGDTIVFKPATDTPALGHRFVELLDEAGVPKGVVNIVHGGGGQVGDAL